MSTEKHFGDYFQDLTRHLLPSAGFPASCLLPRQENSESCCLLPRRSLLLPTENGVSVCNFRMLSVNLQDLKPTGSRLSSYALSLQRDSPNVFKRYVDKLKSIALYDPFATPISQAQLPVTVTTGHVVEYLLNFRSPYTGNPIFNDRSLEGYRKYEAGFVHSVSGKIVNGNYVVSGKV